jgi:hypothetical protein
MITGYQNRVYFHHIDVKWLEGAELDEETAIQAVIR